MVHAAIVNYLQEGKRRGFSLYLLKKKLLEGGFVEKDIDEAIDLVEKESATQVPPPVQPLPRAQISQNIVQPVAEKRQLIQNDLLKSDVQELPIYRTPPKTDLPNSNYRGARWMKIAAVVGVFIFLASIALGVVQVLYPEMYLGFITNVSYTIISCIVFFVAIFFYYFGFVKLGAHTDEGLLRTGAWLVIVPLFLSFVTIFIAQTLVPDQLNVLFAEGNAGPLKTVMVTLSIIWVILFLLTILGQLLLSIGLMRAGNQVKYGKVAGILNALVFFAGLVFVVGIVMVIYSLLNLLSGELPAFTGGIELLGTGVAALVTTFAIIGAFVLKLVAFVFEIIVLFKASKQFE